MHVFTATFLLKNWRRMFEMRNTQLSYAYSHYNQDLFRWMQGLYQTFHFLKFGTVINLLGYEGWSENLLIVFDITVRNSSFLLWKLFISAYFNDIVVGAVCCRVDTSDNKKRLYIMTLGALAPYRRLGIGKSGSVVCMYCPVYSEKNGMNGMVKFIYSRNSMIQTPIFWNCLRLSPQAVLKYRCLNHRVSSFLLSINFIISFMPLLSD